MRFPLFALALSMLALSCSRKAEEGLGLNQAPLATASVKDITMADASTLVSTVQVYWTGSDADGFIKGFRLSLNGGAFSPLLSRTDSLFRFTLDSGNITQDIVLRVVAVDDKDAESVPAELILPVRNSPPSVIFNLPFMPRADTALVAMAIPFIATDSDGDETLDKVFFRVNGGEWLELAPRTASVTIIPDNPREARTQTATVYSSTSLEGQGLRQEPTKLQNVNVGNGPNVFEIKARDLAGSESPIAQITQGDGTQRGFHFRPVTSDLLVIDAHTGLGSPAPEKIYYPTLDEVYPTGYDKLDLLVGQGRNQQRLVNLTVLPMLLQYKKVFWFSDKSRTFPGAGQPTINRVDTTLLLIETYAPFLANFYARAGKHVLFSGNFPDDNTRLTTSSPIYAFLPIDSLLSQSNTARLGRYRAVTPKIAGYPELRTPTLDQGFDAQDGIDTFYPNAQCDSFYTAPITGVAVPNYSRAIGGRFPKGASSPSLIFFTFDLHYLSGTPSPGTEIGQPFKDFFNKVLNTDFN